MESVEHMFLSIHINDSHWGIAVFSVKEKTVFLDHGYHCPIPKDLKRNSEEILTIIHETTGAGAYLPATWDNVRCFRVPMPTTCRANGGNFRP